MRGKGMGENVEGRQKYRTKAKDKKVLKERGNKKVHRV